MVRVGLNDRAYYFHIYDTPLGHRWLSAFNDNLKNKLIVEKNFCFIGFADSNRNLNYLVRELNKNIEQINNIPQILKLKGDFNLVISDIAPNLSGIKSVDNENIFDLNKLTVNIALNFLCKGGTLIMKTFQNSFLKTLRKDMELSFKIVQTYKPVASKKQSGEIYLYGVK